MSPRWHQLLFGVILFWAVSSQEQTVVNRPQSRPPDKPSVEVFLTASDKHGSPAVPTQSELSVLVDKQPAEIGALRPAKSDALLFAVLVDTSGSTARSADLIKQVTLQIFQNLGARATKATSFYLTTLL